MSFKKEINDSLLLGVLNLNSINQLINDGFIQGANQEEIKKDIEAKKQSSALDLKLSDVGWKLTSTLKPKDINSNEPIVYLMNKFATELKGLEKGVKLEKGEVYLIKLQEILFLDNELKVYAQASGKSTIGRLDILTRLIIDSSPIYDEVPAGYKGPLYVEIIPLSFPIVVRKNDSLNQIRFFHGHPNQSLLDPEQLNEMSSKTPIILNEHGATKINAINRLSIDLTPIQCGNDVGCAFVAKIGDQLKEIDLSQRGYKPRDYWDLVSGEDNNLRMIKDSFYIIRSKERFFLPDDIAVRCIAYTENLGETRIHYAGFAHPWFARGSGRKKINGAPLIFEVRCHSFPVLARDGEDFARIEFYRMAERTKVQNPDYDPQELKLSKYFDDWS